MVLCWTSPQTPLSGPNPQETPPLKQLRSDLSSQPPQATESQLHSLLEALDAIHQRYLQEVVEELNICPYARKSREQGRVLRPWLVGALQTFDTQNIAQRLHTIKKEAPSTEILLLTFLLPPEDAGQRLADFEAWHRELRQAMATLQSDRPWYSVVFHPRAGDKVESTRDPAAFVQLLRRSPDPVIQCVCAQTLEAVRQKAQANAQQKIMRELQAKDPSIALLAKSCVMTDSSLSEDIARNNFERWAQDPAFAQLMQRLEAIHRARSAVPIPRNLFVQDLTPPNEGGTPRF